MVKGFSDFFGLDLIDQLIQEEKESINKEFEEAQKFSNSVHEVLDDMVKNGILTCEETTDNGVTRRVYHTTCKNSEGNSEEKANVKTAEEKKEYVKPEVKPLPFLMSASQLDRFIKAYRELIESEKKLSYL